MKKLFLAVLLCCLGLIFVVGQVTAEKVETFKVLKVIDGDTLVVDVKGKKETVRLLGIDTPETVDPRKPVQCFGKAASDKMKSFVHGKFVILVEDKTQGDRDSYKRLLRYVYLPDSKRTFVNGEMVKQGFAFSYKEYPTQMLAKFNNFEKYAKEKNLGLWGACFLEKEKLTPTKVMIKLPTSPPPLIQNIQPPQVKSQSTYSGGDKDCGHFATQAQAQAFFLSQGGPASDPHRLDSDGDGLACETLP